MSLVPDYDVLESSSDSENESFGNNSLLDKIRENERTVIDEEKHSKLPTPDFICSYKKNVASISVFKNPFIEAENAKTAVLEKHVKMVNRLDNTALINGKRICWNYRKGKCRFGHNCKYAHDSELQKSQEQLTAENQIQQTILYQNQNLPQTTSNEIKSMQAEFTKTNEKRKRPGLTQGLIPGKKVMKKYYNHKE